MDREHAYCRACELIDEFERELDAKASGREKAYGPWKYPREIILADLRVKLYDSSARGVELDEFLYRYFDSVSKRRFVMVGDGEPSAPAPVRAATFSRQSDRKVNSGFVGTERQVRAESPSFADDDDTLGGIGCF